MRQRAAWVTAGVLVGVAGGLFGCGSSQRVDETERSITADQLPPAVRATAERLAAFGGGRIGEIEIETEDGVTVYEVEISGPGGEIEVEIARDGTVLELEFEDEDGDDDDDEAGAGGGDGRLGGAVVVE